MISLVRTQKCYHRCLRMPSLKQGLVLTAIMLLFHNEYFCFVTSRWHWASLPAHNQDKSSELRILLVADPQLVGLRDEHPVFGTINRWDCDRYLRSGFQEAFNYVRPDVVLFLGDLLDEGSVATEEEFATYMSRFQSVFQVPSTIQKVFIPGDNDVGGEGFEMKEKWKFNRFFKNFDRIDNRSSSDVINVKFVDFFKLSYDFGEEIASSMTASLMNMTQRSKAPLRVICNHMGIFSRHPMQYTPLIQITKPSLFITAHTHKAVIYHCPDCGKDYHDPKNRLVTPAKSKGHADQGWPGSIISISDNELYSFKLDHIGSYLELVVPTCSYRMGVEEIGYGVAVIGSAGSLEYAVLWLPSRYRLLYSYVIFLVIACSAVILRKLVLCFKSGHPVHRTKPPSLYK